MPQVDFEDPMDFGMGVDRLRLLARGPGVTGSAPDSVSGGGGQTIQISLKKIETYEDFQSAFDFDADVSASYGLFHASAKFKYAERHKFKSFSRYLVAIEYIQRFPYQFVNPDSDSLAQMHTQVAQLLNQIMRSASVCANKIRDCQFTELSIPTFALPPLQPDVQKTQSPVHQQHSGSEETSGLEGAYIPLSSISPEMRHLAVKERGGISDIK